MRLVRIYALLALVVGVGRAFTSSDSAETDVLPKVRWDTLLIAPTVLIAGTLMLTVTVDEPAQGTDKQVTSTLAQLLAVLFLALVVESRVFDPRGVPDPDRLLSGAVGVGAVGGLGILALMWQWAFGREDEVLLWCPYVATALLLVWVIMVPLLVKRPADS